MNVIRTKWKEMMLFAIFFIGILLNYPYTHYVEPDGFDMWSNNIMVSDMIYCEHYGLDTVFLQEITPVIEEEIFGYSSKELQKELFESGTAIAKEHFITYHSNIVLQRYGYAFLNEILPVSGEVLLLILLVINVGLFAGMAAVIANWIRCEFGDFPAFATTILLVVTCPAFAAAGHNLYWIPWSLYFSMAMMILLLNSKKYQEAPDTKKNIALFICTIISCMIKQLMYFELVSTIMVAITIPLIYEYFLNWKEWKRYLKSGIFVFIGAIFSFGVVNVLKFFMHIFEQGSIEKAIWVMKGLIYARLVGDTSSVDEVAAWAARIPRGDVIKRMFEMPAIMFGEDVYLSQGQLTWIVFATSIAGLVIQFVKKKYCGRFNRRWFALLGTTIISVLAPLSWFFLAKVHTYIHKEYMSIAWFMPFAILELVFVCYTISELADCVKKRK